MNQIVTIILPVFGLIAIGYAAGRWKKAPAGALGWLHFLVFMVALPALFFHAVARTPLELMMGWPFVLTAAFGTYCAFAVAFSIAALANRGQVPEATIEGLTGSYSNGLYLAPALAAAAFGPAALAPTALLVSIDHVLFVALVPAMMALGDTNRTDTGALLSRIGRGIMRQPAVLATVAGLAVAATGLSLPSAVSELLSLLGAAAGPGALFALGVTLALQQPKRVPADTALMISLKLLLHPLIIYLLMTWIGGFDRLWVYTAVLIAALPPAVGIASFARQYRMRTDRISAASFIATVLSVVTLIGLIWLMLDGRLPVETLR